MRFSRVPVLFVLLFVLSWPALSQPKSAPKSGSATTASVRAFVQKFYDWYLNTSMEDPRPAWEFLLDEPPATLSPELISALKVDWEAQQKVDNENVGLDFDPFFSGNDPCDRYVVGKVHSKAGHYLVDMYCIRNEKKESKPCAAADVVRKNGRWLIVNVWYGTGGEMLGVLEFLRDKRAKDAH